MQIAAPAPPPRPAPSKGNSLDDLAGRVEAIEKAEIELQVRRAAAKLAIALSSTPLHMPRTAPVPFVSRNGIREVLCQVHW